LRQESEELKESHSKEVEKMVADFDNIAQRFKQKQDQSKAKLKELTNLLKQANDRQSSSEEDLRAQIKVLEGRLETKVKEALDLAQERVEAEFKLRLNQIEESYQK
jgi:phage-related minor tail protein